MTWVKLDPAMPEHVKVASLNDRTFRVYINGLCYAARNKTDGRIPGAILRSLGGVDRHADQLVEAGLWDHVDGGKGWQVHDYLDYNFSRADLDARAEKAREKATKAANVRWNSDAPP